MQAWRDGRRNNREDCGRQVCPSIPSKDYDEEMCPLR